MGFGCGGYGGNVGGYGYGGGYGGKHICINRSVVYFVNYCWCKLLLNFLSKKVAQFPLSGFFCSFNHHFTSHSYYIRDLRELTAVKKGGHKKWIINFLKILRKKQALI